MKFEQRAENMNDQTYF